MSESFYLDYAQRLADQGDLASAEEALRVMFRLPGFRPDAALALAEVLFRRGRPDEAVAVLKAHADNPSCADRLREYYVGESEFEAAKTLLASRPKSLNASGWLDKALVRQLAGDLRGAIDACHAALALEPDDVFALNALGRAQFNAGKASMARDLFVKVTAIRPLLAEGWHNLAHVLRADGSLEASIQAYEKALACAPAHRSARRNMAVTLLMARRMADALPILQNLIDEDENDADAMINFGICLQLLGRVAEAEQHMRIQLGRFPGNFIVQAQLGRLLCRTGHFDEGCILLGAALDLRPHESELRLDYASALMQLRRVSEAEGRIREGLAMAPTHAGLLRLFEHIRKARGIRTS